MTTSPETTATPDLAAEPVCDLSRKFVRVLRETADRRMAFEFAIGVPGLEPQYALLEASRQRTN